MAWVYLDDHFDEHPKLVGAYERDPHALIVFISGLAYCRRNDTDGLILGAKVRGLLGWRPKAQKALLDLELWHDAGNGAVVVHDYEDWNRTSDQRSASARNAAQIRWAKERERKAAK